MTIKEWIKKLENLGELHPSRLDAECMFTVQPQDDSTAYECCEFAALFVAEDASNMDLAYVDLAFTENDLTIKER